MCKYGEGQKEVEEEIEEEEEEELVKINTIFFRNYLIQIVFLKALRTSMEYS